MTLTTISDPAAEPLDAAGAKAQMRVEHSADDDLIEALIAAGRGMVENYLRRRLITQTVRLTLDGFGDGVCEATPLPVAPIQSVDQVQYLDADGVWQTVASSGYRLRDSVVPHELLPAYGSTWPTPRPDFATVRIDLVVGYGATGADLPPPVLQAVKLVVAHFYQHREAVTPNGSAAELPLGVQALLAPYRLWI